MFNFWMFNKEWCFLHSIIDIWIISSIQYLCLVLRNSAFMCYFLWANHLLSIYNFFTIFFVLLYLLVFVNFLFVNSPSSFFHAIFTVSSIFIVGLIGLTVFTKDCCPSLRICGLTTKRLKDGRDIIFAINFVMQLLTL